MTTAPPDVSRRILFILHRGLVELRNHALAGDQQQLADLADALEVIPGCLNNWSDEREELLRTVLEAYEHQYPVGRYDYLPFLDGRYHIPECY